MCLCGSTKAAGYLTINITRLITEVPVVLNKVPDCISIFNNIQRVSVDDMLDIEDNVLVLWSLDDLE